MSGKLSDKDHQIRKEVREEWEDIIQSDSDRLDNMEEIVKENIEDRSQFTPLALLNRIRKSFNRLAENLTTWQKYAISGGAVAAVILGLALGWFISPTRNTGRNMVIFKVPAQNAQTVGLAGDFNAYDPINMKDKNGDGVWTVRLSLEEGKYEYYYLVDGKKLSGDYPMADEVVRDWKNRKNAIRFVGEEEDEHGDTEATA
ncbi:hypothetical protein KGY77_09700 [Candidatus Bipolaricaulota bacterium]|nr:hypothetical protein [Candidatus Bipolaricaulota bacterium]MBS3792899.1 hypothetical protein [Candidatus Bipolaricaulota bacterium]